MELGELLQTMRVSCHEISMAYQHRGRPLEVLRKVSFEVEAEEFVCLVGPSGCGKTTLLKVLAGLVHPYAGRVDFVGSSNGNPVTAMVFQDHGLFPWMTVMNNVTFGLVMRGLPQAECTRRALPLLERAGLARFGHSYPHELSIGMKQRAGLIRAFVTDPAVLLMDEPFASLDAQTKLILQDELLRILRDYPRPVVYVTHDIEEAILLSDRVLVMSARPAEITGEFRVPFARPRKLGLMQTPQFADLKGLIWRDLEAAVRYQSQQ